MNVKKIISRLFFASIMIYYTYRRAGNIFKYAYRGDCKS